jgi:GrpB-like predicted nucleotidyltransferase (UPF0157 family)
MTDHHLRIVPYDPDHVHVVERGGAEERRTLAFRDYLRDHVAAAREYEHLKQDLARQFAATDGESREAYCLAKTDFVERIVAIALASGYPREFLHAGELPGNNALHPSASRKWIGRG